MKKMLLVATTVTLMASFAAGIAHVAWASCTSPNVVPKPGAILDQVVDPFCPAVKQNPADGLWHNQFTVHYTGTNMTIFQESSEAANTAGTTAVSVDGGAPFQVGSGYPFTLTTGNHTIHVTTSNVASANNGVGTIKMIPTGEAARVFGWHTQHT